MLSLEELNQNGIILFKLKKEYFSNDSDIFFCCCYIPPDGSNVYKNVNSSLYEFDFFEYLNNDIVKYRLLGDVYLTGDLNSRVGQKADYVDNVNLDRYVDLPDSDLNVLDIPPRVSMDSTVNTFGNRLLNLCKANNLLIANGRCENGDFTCRSLNRHFAASVVDYVITEANCLMNIDHMSVLDQTEFSDHCPVVFSIDFEYMLFHKTDTLTYDKIIWNDENMDIFNNALQEKIHVFDEQCQLLSNGDIDINTCVNTFSNIIYDISFQTKGKTFSINRKPKVPKCPWFDENCRNCKNVFYRCKALYKNTPTDENRERFLNSRRDYCKCKKNAKSRYYAKEKHKLSSLSRNNPRQFWKYINNYKKRNKTSDNIKLDEFVEHFQTLSNTPHEEFQNNDFIPNPQNETINIEDLDREITLEEVSKTISSLQRNKSCDYDKNVADFFIDSKDIISPYLVHIFNHIFNSGVYPDSWSKGVLVPIYKKGNKSNPSNYRGITIINVIAKIFSLVLRNRINKWCEETETLNNLQFGFRDERSTADCIFILHSIIQKVLANKSKLFCAFVDYEKALDTIVRDALWLKIVDLNISSKMLSMLKSIYQSVKSCVKLSSTMQMSDFFDVALGLKQGEPLSPLLFIIFINDVNNIVDPNSLTENDINLLNIYMLLFADDIALFTTNPQSLQNQLNELYQYSKKWGLKINVKKTKICIFQKRWQNPDFDFTINNDNVEVVKNFVYLGINFTHTGNLVNAVKSLQEQALVAYNNILSIFSRVNLDTKTKIKLFDCMVTPIILYGSEVWGIYDFKEIDRLQLRFLKNILGVRQQTPNVAVFGEVGCIPLSVIAKIRSLKYW